MKTIWLTVDWDFFQEERAEWDWSHAERGAMYSSLVWPTRTFVNGEDIRPVTHPAKHFPPHTDFWSRLKGMDFSHTMEIGVADSHAVAWPYFFQQSHSGVPDEVWNFDAHHDLGYTRLQELRAWVREEKAEAGSWAYLLLRKFPGLLYRHVRPTWRPLTAEPTPWRGERSLARRVTRMAVRDFDWDEQVRVTGLFIAKSEAWSPPWNDPHFTRFLAGAEERTGLGLAIYGNDVTQERTFPTEDEVQMLGRFISGQVSAHDWLKQRSEFTTKEET